MVKSKIRLMLALGVVLAAGQMWAQNACYHAQFFSPISGKPLASPSVRVCIEAATGTTCTPLAPALYTDVGSSNPLSNPFNGDSHGNVDFCSAPGPLYHIQVVASAAQGSTQQDVSNVAIMGSNVAWSKITGTPSTLSGYGITDAVHNSGDEIIHGTKTFDTLAVGTTVIDTASFGSANGTLHPSVCGMTSTPGFTVPAWCSGSTADAWLRAAISQLASTGGTIDISDIGATFSSTVVTAVSKPLRIELGPFTYSCPGGATPSPCFQTWSGANAYSYISFSGKGRGVTTLQIPSGATCTATNRCNIFELHDPSDTSDAKPNSSHITIANLTMDGNKANVAQPPGGIANDVAHNGIMSNGSDHVVVSNVGAKNWWYGGIDFGLYNTYDQVDGPYTENCGYSVGGGYGGILLQGSSYHNIIIGHISKGDVIGAWLLNNLSDNHYQGTIDSPLAQGLVLNDSAGGNSSYDNTVEVSVNAPASQGCSIGSGSGGITRDNTISCTVHGSAASQGVLVGGGAKGNHLTVQVSQGQAAGLELAGLGNTVLLAATDNSQSGAGNDYALRLDATAANNIVYGTCADDQGSATQRCVLDTVGSSNNKVELVRSGSLAGVNLQTGTNNDIRLWGLGIGLVEYQNGAQITATQTIASGTVALGTASISSNACATTVTASATGVLSTDAIAWSFNADPNAINGYGAGASGPLSVWPFATADNVKFRVCNLTGGPITPGAATLNWRVTR